MGSTPAPIVVSLSPTFSFGFSRVAGTHRRRSAPCPRRSSSLEHAWRLVIVIVIVFSLLCLWEVFWHCGMRGGQKGG
ncbi:hypothetical protein NL676_026315 [Syzygium grande]|nr:hypothetical protein NL676_026315 [Syzygium grande]